MGLPITEMAQKYCAENKDKSDARKHLDEGWQKHYDIEIEDAYTSAANWAYETAVKQFQALFADGLSATVKLNALQDNLEMNINLKR